jgi:hypothetical protein
MSKKDETDAHDVGRFGLALAEIEEYDNCCPHCGLPLKYWNETLGFMRMLHCTSCDKVFPEDNNEIR